MSNHFLVIVESPSKTKKIESYLNNIDSNKKYRVIASKGHIRCIKGLKSILVKNNYEIQFSNIPEKISHIKSMKSIIDTYPKQNIILATDNDREGEAIAYHICIVFNLPIETTTRILFNEITQSALKNAIIKPTILNMDLVKSQHARQILDMFIGYKISPLLWKYVFSSKSKSLSSGRCQTPALRLVYDNYKQGETKQYQEKYNTFGMFFHKYMLKFKLNKDFTDENELKCFLEESKNYHYSFQNNKGQIIEKPNSIRSPPHPLNTSKLLQYANNCLHMSPKTTMEVAQKLYQEGFITYHRTESKKYCKDFLNKASQYILKICNNDSKYLHTDINKISNEGDAMPHEAIRITNVELKYIESTDNRMCSLYKFIWKNTIESCMSSAIFESYSIELSAALGHKFTYNLQIPRFDGWMKINENKDINLGEKEYSLLFYLKSLKNSFSPLYIESNVDITGLHSHFTESGLIQKLEELGIGRPSTYAMFVETIKERDYVKKQDIDGINIESNQYKLTGDLIEIVKTNKVFGNEKGKLVIQPLGVLCIEFLLQHFDNIFDYSYTKNIEEELDKIKEVDEGTSSWYSICENVLKDIQQRTKKLNSMKKLVFPIDDNNEIVFLSQGPCVRKKIQNNENIEYEFLPIIPSIDVNKIIKEGSLGISLNEIVLYNSSNLGKYDNGNNVYLKTGQYGHYLECGDIHKTLKDLSNEEIKNIDLDKAIQILFNQENDSINSKMILRNINSQMSIRKGKFGSYVFYLESQNKTPSFINLKKFKEDYMTCDTSIIIEWVLEQINLPKKPRVFKKYISKTGSKTNN